MNAAEAPYGAGDGSVAAPSTITAAIAAAVATIGGAADITGISGAAAHCGPLPRLENIKGKNDPEGDESRKDGDAEQSVRSDGVHDGLCF
ncbi:hypothetical protein [Rhizobium terrae]|uniref:hypothetical protein n=1 Tax=Rhizobium terrae TaxID=2171756 RepID=UPI000E3BBD42|nr:hypothetical protein [Rhizobium terrae]